MSALTIFFVWLSNEVKSVSLPFQTICEFTLKLLFQSSARQEMQPLMLVRLSVCFSSVDVFLPKFSISTDYALKEILTEMGMVDAFTDSADFSGISEQQSKMSKVGDCQSPGCIAL